MREVNAYAAIKQGQELVKYTYNLKDIEPEYVDIKVMYCGICHSDLSMLNNDWGSTTYPFVPGHEIVGIVVDKGNQVHNLQIGDKVGLGWFSDSCMHCNTCMHGDHHLCRSIESTIVGRHGGFADHVRSHWSWAIPLPNEIDMKRAGPLLCGGITVFNPIMNFVKPTDTVGVIGIGGLGHIAIKILNKWGCEVIAFSSSKEKADEIKQMGAHKVMHSKNKTDLKKWKSKLNFIINTTNVNLDWNTYLSMLTPNGSLHTVGAILDPMPISAFSLIGGQKSISGSPVGSPANTRLMLSFCSRHDIYPTVESFPLAEVNTALEYLKSGKARYRIVLKI